jgi:purine-binding chemotaxis protein CheW
MNRQLDDLEGLNGQLTFLVAGRHHAIPLEAVQEVLQLPWLQSPEGAPACVAGLLNLRGGVVTVLDLARRLGLPSRAPDPGDALIVLAGTSWGLWVEQVEGVLDLGAALPVEIPAGTEGVQSFERGLAAHGTELYHLLDLDRILAPPFPAGSAEPPFYGLEAGIQDLFRARSEANLESPALESPTLLSVLTFELGGESFALGLEGIREIIPCPPIHPLPGAASEYLGLVVHRGEPVLVADLRPRLGLAQTPEPAGGKLIVVELEGRLALYASEIGSVRRLDSQHLLPPLLAQGGPDAVKGQWVVDGRPLSLLRLRALLAAPESLHALSG